MQTFFHVSNIDVCSHIIHHLNAYETIKCSMVNKFLKSMADNECRVFQKNMSFSHSSLSFFNHNVMTTITDLNFVENVHELYGKLYVDSTIWFKMAKYLSNQIGDHLRMRTSFRIPTSLVNFITPISLKKQKELGIDKFVIMDVVEWKLVKTYPVDMEETSTLTESKKRENKFWWWMLQISEKKNIRLSATKYVFRFGARNITKDLRFAVILDLDNVCILKTITSREKFVLNQTKQCMHCHQRKRKVESLNVCHANHRVLCTTCFKELYVSFDQLSTVYKCAYLKQKIKKMRRHEVMMHIEEMQNEFEFQIVHFVQSTKWPERKWQGPNIVICVLKDDFAKTQQYSSWIDFIQNNFKKPLIRGEEQKKGPDKFNYNSTLNSLP